MIKDYSRVQLVLFANVVNSWRHSSWDQSLNSQVGTHLRSAQRWYSSVHSTYVTYWKLSPNIFFCSRQCGQVLLPYMTAQLSVRHWAKLSRFPDGFDWVHHAKNSEANIPTITIFFILLYIRDKIYTIYSSFSSITFN